MLRINYSSKCFFFWLTSSTLIVWDILQLKENTYLYRNIFMFMGGVREGRQEMILKTERNNRTQGVFPGAGIMPGNRGRSGKTSYTSGPGPGQNRPMGPSHRYSQGRFSLSNSCQEFQLCLAISAMKGLGRGWTWGGKCWEIEMSLIYYSIPSPDWVQFSLFRLTPSLSCFWLLPPDPGGEKMKS